MAKQNPVRIKIINDGISMPLPNPVCFHGFIRQLLGENILKHIIRVSHKIMSNVHDAEQLSGQDEKLFGKTAQQISPESHYL